MKRLLAAFVICLALPTILHAEGSILLTATTDSLELETSAAVNTDYRCSFADHTTTAFTPGSSHGQITTATTTTIIAAPAASTQRQVKVCSIYNRSTSTAQTITFKFDTSATERHLYRATLGSLESAQFHEGRGFFRFDSGGRELGRVQDISGFTGRVYDYFKVGTAAEAIGVRYGFAKDTGLPGAWVPGTPGLNGAASNCDTTSGASILGSHVIPDPASGSLFLTGVGLSTSVAHLVQLMDPIWYNTGIVVTTTTGQAITQPALPARDSDGTTNGDGWNAGIYVTTATGNAAAVTTITLTYTDSDGNAGNTATMASFPATAVLGTFVPFQLEAGDRGIRSIQTITLGTTLTSGAISLVQYRMLASVPVTAANLGAPIAPVLAPPGVRLYNDTCLWVNYVASATTATNFAGTVTIMER